MIRMTFRTGLLAQWLRTFLLLVISGVIALPALAAEASVSASVAHRIFEWRPFLAPFHAVVLHFPIGFITIAFLLEIYRLRRPSEDLRRVTHLVLWLALLSAAVTATFGLMRADTGEYEKRAVELHRAFGLWVPILLGVTLVTQKTAYRLAGNRAWTYAYRLFLTVTVGAVTMAGHYGGNLTHGSRYLVENAPDFVRELIDDTPNPASATANLSENQRFFVERVQPIFSSKCYQCHGAEKQKNGYRLDDPVIALKGGKSGKPAIKAGDPAGSNLVRLILLSPTDDDAMPPSGKEPLTNDEIMTILTWVRKGAAIPGSVPPTPAANPPNG